MKRVKIFHATDFIELEQQVNTWLKANQDIVIEDRLQDVGLNNDGFEVFVISIFYY